MKPKCILFIACLVSLIVQGQKRETDSLQNLLARAVQDTNRVMLLSQLGYTYRFTKPDSCVILTQQALDLARKLDYSNGEIRSLNTIGESLRTLGEYPKALENEFDALRLSKITHNVEGEAMSLVFIGIVYAEMSGYSEALQYLRQGIEIYKQLAIPRMVSFGLSNVGNVYEKMNQLDSALFFHQQSLKLARQVGNLTLLSLVLTHLGTDEARLGNRELALSYYHQVLQNTAITGDLSNRGNAQVRAAELFFSIHQLDSSLYYARLAFYNGHGVAQRTVFEATDLLSKIYYLQKNLDSAYHYKELAMTEKDSLFSAQKFQRLQLLTSVEHQRQEQLQQEKNKLVYNYRLAALLSAVAIFLLIAIFLWRNNRKQKQTNHRLNEQNEEIAQQHNNLKKALDELKSTQAQLIQSEKMASLGELTAGVAHEIQNPLNFVNNFSELNTELIGELQEQLKSGKTDEATTISNDIRENEEKITFHGKRADAIVKGMLQHSRSSSGVKEPTDINALADEYLRLAYHGLRAKDKEFNATMKTDYDETIGKINIVPQDIGRVILNLITNAFYSVGERQKVEGIGYEPTVTVKTSKNPPLGGRGAEVLISVRDNGNGIPQKALDKIFQPFFTTKPTGEGTGLGLSLSYDIIKGHGGELKVETKEKEFAEFTILLPS